jgi:hypothetical protein
VDLCNKFSNELILIRATSMMTRENVERLERYEEIEKIVKRRWTL